MKHKTLRTLLCVILTVCFCLSAIAPVSAAGLFSGDSGAASIFDEWIRSLKDRFTEIQPGEDATPVANETATGNDFIRIFHLDCGRKYFTVDQIKGIIDELAANNYTHIELAFGNDGFRFLLDDMSVTVDGKTYSHDDVKASIQAGNSAYYNFEGKNELTEAEMDDIIAYAKKGGKNNGHSISVIPMVDVPGHANALMTAMTKLGISVSTFYKESNNGLAFDVSKKETTSFVTALLTKYIGYFAKNGCEYFNLGADECGYSESTFSYSSLIDNLLSPLGKKIADSGMTPLMFNDGFRSSNDLQTLVANLKSDNNKPIFAICYWTANDDKGYATAAQLANDFQLINTNTHWYYIAGNEGTSWGNYEYAIAKMKQDGFKANNCDSDTQGKIMPMGCMLAFWCDQPGRSVNYSNLYTYIKTLSEQNPTYFKAPATPVAPTITVSANSLTVDGTATVSTSDGSLATWASSDEMVLEVVATKDVTAASVTVRAVGAGTATVTAKLSDGITLTSETITVRNKGEVTYEEERTVTVTAGQTLTLEKTIAGQYDGTQENDYAKVVATSREVAGETTYTKASLGAGTFYISTSANATSFSTSITLEDAGNGQYYLMYNGKYVYPDASYSSWGNSWTYKLSSGKEAVSISEKNSSVSISKSITATYKESITATYKEGWNNTQTVTTTAYIRLNGSSLISNNNSQNLYLYEQKTTPAGYETVVTVTGKQVTTNPVEMIVGTVKYLITVTAEDLSNVTPLPIQLWITNIPIELETSQGSKTSGSFRENNSWSEEKAFYVSVNASDAYGEDGVALSAVLPTSMTRYENNITYWIAPIKTSQVARELVLWSGRIHTSADKNIQKIWDTDYSNSGSEFNFVRYYGSKWEVSATGEKDTWIPVTGDGSTVSYSCTEQLAAYYMIRTDITDEVTTDVADWGYTATTEYDDIVKKGQYVVLDYAVKYPDGTRNPEGFPVTGKTFVFHCDENKANNTGSPVKSISSGSTTKYYRQLNNFRAVENLNGYEVYMVTVTMTSKDLTSDTTAYDLKSAITYDSTTEQIVWAIDEATRDNSGLNPYTSISGTDSDYSGCTIGGEPYVRGVEVYEKNGALITYYVRAKYSEDNLTVHYIDKTNDKEFHNYDIAVKSGTTFDANISLADPWKGPLANGSVKNNLDVTQTVSADLTTMPAIPAQYRYVDYTCVEVVRSEDGKEVFLYYTFDADVSFVVDFGLPLTIPYTALNENLSNTSVEIKKITTGTAKYGTLSVNGTESITYTPNQTIDTNDSFNVTCTGTIPVQDETTGKTKYQEGEVTYTVYIIPATNVLYEENFITNPENSGWTNAGSADSVNQTLEEAGKKQNVYGYDTQVENYYLGDDDSVGKGITYSMGGAYQATLNLTDLSNTSYTFSEPLKFTFEGTGIDLISACNDKTGMLYVEVIGDKNGGVYRALVDTYFAGDSNSIIEKGSTIYQVPVVRKLDLPYDNYTVTIKGYLYNKAGAVVNGADTSALASLYNAFGETAEDAVSTLVDALAIPGLTVDDIDVIYMDDNSILNPNAEITKVREENSVMAAYTLDAAENTASSATVYVDGFRIYNPLGTSGTVTYDEKNTAGKVVTHTSYISLTDNEAYNSDDEDGVVYYPAYDLIKMSAVESGDLVHDGLLYVEYDGSTGIASIANYKNQGPQNEIYLAPGASIAFGIDNVNGAVYQVSVREVTSGGSLTNLANRDVYVNSTEMYYDFTLQTGTIDGKSYSYAVFTNDKDGVVAVSGLKLSSSVKPYISEELANMITEKLSKDPTAAFNPSMFEVSYPNTARKNRKFYLNVRASASDVVKVTLSVKDSSGNVVDGYNSLELSPSNSKAVAEGLSKYWMYDQSVKLPSGTYTIEITAYDKDNHAAVYKVSDATGEKVFPVVTVK